MPGVVQGVRQALTADPHHIRGHVVIVGKDHTRRWQCDAGVAWRAPPIERTQEFGTGILVMIPRLTRHVEFSINNFIALAVVWQNLQISRGPADRRSHTVVLSGCAAAYVSWKTSGRCRQ